MEWNRHILVYATPKPGGLGAPAKRALRALLSGMRKRWLIIILGAVVLALMVCYANRIVTVLYWKRNFRPSLRTTPLSDGKLEVTLDLSRSTIPEVAIGTAINCDATRLRLSGVECDPADLYWSRSFRYMHMGGGHGFADISFAQVGSSIAPGGPAKLVCNLHVRITEPAMFGLWKATTEFPLEIVTMVNLSPGQLPVKFVPAAPRAVPRP